MFNNILSIFNWSNLTDREKVFFKGDLYGLTEKKVSEKVAFAFFLDKDLSAALEPSFDHLQYCAGSLSENFFIKILGNLVQSKKALSLSKNSQEVVNNYIIALKGGSSFSFFVDATRSTNPFLCLFASTGNLFWKAMPRTSFSNEEIDKTVNKIDQEVHSLKVGEEKIFMLGSLFHETRLYVERADHDTLTFAYFDPGSASSLNYSYSIPRLVAQGDSFWRPLCQQKYADRGDNSTITQHLDTNGSKQAVDIDAILRPQWQASCHLRSLLGPLKWQLNVACKNAGIGFEAEWKKCKYLIGAFIAEELSSNPSLETLTNKKLLVLEKKSAVAARLAEAAISKDSLVATINQIEKLLSLFYVTHSTNESTYGMDLKCKLHFSARQLQRLMDLSATDLTRFSSVFSESPLANAIFELSLTKTEKHGIMLTVENVLGFLDDGKSIFIPVVELLLKNVKIADTSPLFYFLRTLTLFLDPKHESVRSLLRIALDHYRSTEKTLSPLHMSNSNLLLDKIFWRVAARMLDESKLNSQKDLGFKITIQLMEIQFKKNPHRDWTREIEELGDINQAKYKQLRDFYLWKMHYQDGNFKELFKIKLGENFFAENSISLDDLHYHFTSDSYEKFRSFAKRLKNLPFKITSLFVRDIADLSCRENKSAIFFEFISVLERSIENGLRYYSAIISDDALLFLVKESLERRLPIDTMLGLSILPFNKNRNALFHQNIEPHLKKAIENRIYKTPLLLEDRNFDLFSHQFPKGSWTAQFLGIIKYLAKHQGIHISRLDQLSIIEEPETLAPTFKALPKGVQDDLLQAIDLSGVNQRELSLIFGELDLKTDH